LFCHLAARIAVSGTQVQTGDLEYPAVAPMREEIDRVDRESFIFIYLPLYLGVEKR
jgi:hypothetical protein